MTPMTPTIRVSPLAIKNKTRPSWRPLRSCASSPGKSMPLSRGRRSTKAGPPLWRTGTVSSRLGQLAAGTGIRQIFGGNADHLVLAALGPTQVDVLRDVLGWRHGDGAAGAVEFGGAQGFIEICLVLDVALDGLETEGEQLGGIVALYGVDIGLAPGFVLEGLAEGGVLGIVDPIAIVQRRLHALRRGSLRFERSLGEEARAAQGCFEACGRVFLDKLDRPAAGEEGTDHVDAEAWDLRQQRLEIGLREG